MPEGSFTLDEVLGNPTDLPIAEHTVDTGGQTLALFAAFDLVGLRFSPRIRDLPSRRLYRLGPAKDLASYPHAGPLLRQRINTGLILGQWDELLRLGGSLKFGHATASLLLAKLQSGSRQNAVARGLLEYGRLIRTLFILRYLADPELQRRVHHQLNKGESLHALRRRLLYANEGHIRRRHDDAQTEQALCLTVVTNAVVLSNTVYLQDALDALRTEGTPVNDEHGGGLRSCLAHLCEQGAHLEAPWRATAVVEASVALGEALPRRLAANPGEIPMALMGGLEVCWIAAQRSRRTRKRYRPSSSLGSSAAKSALPVFRHQAGMSNQLPGSVVMSSKDSPRATLRAASLASMTGPGQHRPEASTTSVGMTGSEVAGCGAMTLSLTFVLFSRMEVVGLLSALLLTARESRSGARFRSTGWCRLRGPGRSRTTWRPRSRRPRAGGSLSSRRRSGRRGCRRRWRPCRCA